METAAMPKTRMFARLALRMLVLTCGLFVLVHILKPDYDIKTYMISHYSIGQYGWVMKMTFMAWATGLLSLSLSLIFSEHSSWPRKIGAALLIITAIGLVVSGIYDTALPGRPDTPESDIHDGSFYVNVISLLIAIPLISFGLRSAAWKPFRLTAITLATLVVLAFILFFSTLHKGMPYGVTNRIFAATLLAWMIALANRLKSFPTHETKAPGRGA
jgi:hypothetical membrane protein